LPWRPANLGKGLPSAGGERRHLDDGRLMQLLGPQDGRDGGGRDVHLPAPGMAQRGGDHGTGQSRGAGRIWSPPELLPPSGLRLPTGFTLLRWPATWIRCRRSADTVGNTERHRCRRQWGTPSSW